MFRNLTANKKTTTLNHFQNGGSQKHDFAVFLIKMAAITYSVVTSVG